MNINKSHSNLKKFFDPYAFTVTALICIFWIIGTDFLVHHFVPQEQQTLYQTVKGILFILVISVILASLHGREKYRIKQQRDRFNLLFESSPCATLIFDTDNNQIVDVNQAALAILKYPRKKLINCDIQTIFNNKEELGPVLEKLNLDESLKYHTESVILDLYKDRVYCYLVFANLTINGSHLTLIHLQKKRDHEASLFLENFT